jgi:hypothetical protein
MRALHKNLAKNSPFIQPTNLLNQKYFLIKKKTKGKRNAEAPRNLTS